MLSLLQADLDEGGRGLRLSELAAATGTRWPLSAIRRLREAGANVASVNDRFMLLEAAPTGAPTLTGDTLVRASDSGGAPVDAAPRLFEPAPLSALRDAA